MSRSIHTTWSQMVRIHKKHKYSEAAGDGIEKKLHGMYDEMTQKHKYKKQRISKRKADLSQNVMDMMRVHVDCCDAEVPVIIEDGGELFHYPMDEADIRGILGRLPRGITNGLGFIRLEPGCLTQKYSKNAPDPDPFTGRPGYEILPGVYHPPILGTYHGDSSTISIYAYTYKTLPDAHMWRLCIKIHMMMTLAHELAHHFDYQFRANRGKWPYDGKHKFEWYAGKMEYQWLTEMIIPYIKENYPDDVAHLNEWILTHVGMPLPLEMLAGDPRKTQKNGMIKFGAGTDEYFYDFVRDVYAGKRLIDARISLAEGLHYADVYDLSMQMIEFVLADEPENVRALALKADTLVHLDRYEEAEKIAFRLLQLDENAVDAWEVLCDIYDEKEEWEQLLNASENVIRCQPAERFLSRYNLFEVKALIELGRLETARQRLEVIEMAKVRSAVKRKRIEALREQIDAKQKQVNNDEYKE